MILINIFLIIFTLNKCVCVPPILNTDALKDDVNGIKNMMKTVLGTLENWNNLYMNQIEPKLLSYSVMMTNLDNNLKNLQERAHVWDTFQLHISAWNEQLATTDRKLDIISEGQEKILNSENKANAVSNFEYKLESIQKKLEELEEQLSVTNKKLENSPSRENLFTEFTTRGILSTLKLIERKLDKIQITGHSIGLRKYIANDNKKPLLKCTTPPILEELLHDVSSKVDIIFDNISDKDEIVEETYEREEEYIDDQQVGSGEEPGDAKYDSDIKLIKKLLTRISQPCKKTNKLLEKITTKLSNIENNTALINETRILKITENTECKIEDVKSIVHKAMNRFAIEINKTLYEGDIIVNSHFQEQRAYFEKLFQTIQSQTCWTKYNSTNSIPPTREIISNKTSCEDLDDTNQSGIYIFGDNRDLNELHKNFNTRHCEIREDGKWTVIQARGIQNVPQNFSMDWKHYKNGFGQLNGDFWFGNDFLHKLTYDGSMVLRIELESFNGETAWAQYNLFKVESEISYYKLIISNYKGNASDSLSSHNNSLFSTYDKKNDGAPDCCPCALSFGGGWWFNSCFEANLNGVYYNEPYNNGYYRGLIWEHWLGNYSLKKTKMMIRTRKLNEQLEITTKVVGVVGTSTSFPIQVTTSDIPYYEDP